jgi:hypothetical protein
MDILTEKGQETKRQEDAAIVLWHDRYPNLRYIETPKDKPASVDGLIVKNGVIQAVVETKCRQCSVIEFTVTWESRWLVTAEKIKKGASIARELCVPFVGFLYLPEAKILMHKTLWHPDKGWVAALEEKETRTQATVNGGSVIRLNAFIDMSDAKTIFGDKNDSEFK